MKITHVAGLAIVWAATTAGAYLLHVPEVYFAAGAGTFLMTIAICVEVSQ